MYLLKYLLTLYIPTSLLFLTDRDSLNSSVFPREDTPLSLCFVMPYGPVNLSLLNYNIFYNLSGSTCDAISTATRGSILRISMVSIILNEGSTHRHVQFRANKVNTVSREIRPRKPCYVDPRFVIKGGRVILLPRSWVRSVKQEMGLLTCRRKREIQKYDIYLIHVWTIELDGQITSCSI